MKHGVIAALIVLLFQAHGVAGDFIVEYEKENYHETRLPKSYDPVIYHSVQVTSEAGPKLLVLKGTDYNYRKWLRQYIARGKQFIAQVPDDRDDLFISSYIFEMDVKDLHPFNLGQYRKALDENRSQTSARIPVPDYYQTDSKNKNAARREAEEIRKKKDAKEKQAGLKQKQDALRLKEKQAQKRQSKEKQNQALRQLQQRQQQEKAERFKIELEKQRMEQQNRLAALAERKALEDQRRKAQLERRWLELKAQMMENERLRNMALEERNREIERRWVELQQRYDTF